MIDQHAPSDSLQLASGSHELSIKAQFKKGSIENHKILTIIIVNTVLKGLENKFSLIHPGIPILDMGGLTITLPLFFLVNSIKI